MLRIKSVRDHELGLQETPDFPLYVCADGARTSSSSVRTDAVKQRMKSVKNIEKITKAMKMVAASKMRGVQSKMEQARGFPLPFVRLLGDTPGE